MPAEPLVSIVIPTYDRREFLAEAIRSIADQTYRPVELIVVDDASPDPVEAAHLERCEVSVIRHARNMGPGAARNTGLAHARGEFVIFLDDDDRLAPDRIERAVREIGEARMHAARASVPSRRFEGDMRLTLLHGSVPSTGQVVFRRADVLQFDPTLRVSEDIEWWIRMRDRAIFAWTDDVGLTIRKHTSPRPGVVPAVRSRCRAVVVARHWDDLDATARAHQLNRAGSAALLAQRRVEAARYAMRSLRQKQTTLGWKLLAYSALPARVAARSAASASYAAR